MTIEIIPEYDLGAERSRRVHHLIRTAFEDEHPRPFYGQCPQVRILTFHEMELTGHVALHHRYIAIGGKAYPIIGMADLCVSSSVQGEGIGTELISTVERFCVDRSIEFILVMARSPTYYAKHDFHPVQAVCRWVSIRDLQSVGVLQRALHEGLMYRSVSDTPWPSGPVDMLGHMF